MGSEVDCIENAFYIHFKTDSGPSIKLIQVLSAAIGNRVCIKC